VQNLHITQFVQSYGRSDANIPLSSGEEIGVHNFPEIQMWSAQPFDVSGNHFITDCDSLRGGDAGESAVRFPDAFKNSTGGEQSTVSGPSQQLHIGTKTAGGNRLHEADPASRLFDPADNGQPVEDSVTGLDGLSPSDINNSARALDDQFRSRQPACTSGSHQQFPQISRQAVTTAQHLRGQQCHLQQCRSNFLRVFRTKPLSIPLQLTTQAGILNHQPSQYLLLFEHFGLKCLFP
jgi:hypothetical protein